MSLFFNKNAWFIGAFPFLRSGIFLSVLDKYPVMCLIDSIRPRLFNELEIMKPLVKSAYLIKNEVDHSYFKQVPVDKLMND